MDRVVTCMDPLSVLEGILDITASHNCKIV